MWVSTIGTWAHNTAVVLLIRELGGGGVELGVAAACQFGPLLLLGLKAGALADQADRYRRTMRLSMVLAIIALALGVIVFSDAVNMAIVYAMTLMFGTASAFENPTRRSFVTDLVPPEQVGNVLSLNTTVMTGARMFGPAIAAVIATASSTGWVFLLNGLSYMALLVAMRQIDRSRLHTVAKPPPSPTPVRDGLRAVWSIPELRITLALFAIVSTFAYNYTVGLPLLVTDRLHADASMYGWLLSAMSLGNVVGALVVARLDLIPFYWVYGAGLSLGVTLAALSFTTSTPAAVLLAVAFGSRHGRVRQLVDDRRPTAHRPGDAQPRARADQRAVHRLDAHRRTDHRCDR